MHAHPRHRITYNIHLWHVWSPDKSFYADDSGLLATLIEARMLATLYLLFSGTFQTHWTVTVDISKRIIYNLFGLIVFLMEENHLSNVEMNRKAQTFKSILFCPIA